jgi:hypothetical protein
VQAVNWPNASVGMRCDRRSGRMRGARQLVAGVSAGQPECRDVNGCTLCRIPVCTKLPSMAAAR